MPWVLLIIKHILPIFEFCIRHSEGLISRPVTFWWPVWGYSSDEREMRRLRRQRIIEEQERQQRLDDEIEYLQHQKEQLISNRRY